MSNISISAGNKTASETFTLNGKKVIPVFYPEGGFIPSSYPSRIYSCMRLSSLAEVGDVSLEFDNERDLFEVGKSKVTVNDGTITSFELTCFGNAYKTLGALHLQDMLAYPVIELGKSTTLAGHLALLSASSDDNDAQFSSFFPNVQIKQTSAPGATDGESTFTIEVKTTETAYHSTNYVLPVKEIFYDDGSTITNAAAPDGTLTVIRLGDGNDNGVATAGPLAVPISSSLTGLSQYFIEIKVDGEAVTSGITYDSSATGGTLTWGTAPADGAKVEATYFARWGAPAYDATKAYGVGHIVESGGSYYTITAGTAAIGVAPGSGPWVAYTAFGYDGTTPISTPVVPHTSGNVSVFGDILDEM